VENIFKIIQYNYINSNKLGKTLTSQLWNVQSVTVSSFQFISATFWHWLIITADKDSKTNGQTLFSLCKNGQ